MYKIIMMAAGMLLTSTAMADLQEMDAESLALATGQEGIALELELRINTTDSIGTPMAACGAGTANGFNLPGSTGCRLGMQFANRGTIAGADGHEWTVWKGYYGNLRIPSLYLDASNNPVASSGYEDLGRFVNASGATVLPYGKSVLAITLPEDIEIWNFNISAISVEYGAAGYLNTTTTAIPANPASLGLKMAGTGVNQPATLRTQGTITIFGF